MWDALGLLTINVFIYDSQSLPGEKEVQSVSVRLDRGVLSCKTICCNNLQAQVYAANFHRWARRGVLAFALAKEVYWVHLVN